MFSASPVSSLDVTASLPASATSLSTFSSRSYFTLFSCHQNVYHSSTTTFTKLRIRLKTDVNHPHKHSSSAYQAFSCKVITLPATARQSTCLYACLCLSVHLSISKTTCPNFNESLTCNAMLVQYMLLPCVCLSVSLSHTSVLSKLLKIYQDIIIIINRFV